jgi:hypothetical protein
VGIGRRVADCGVFCGARKSPLIAWLTNTGDPLRALAEGAEGCYWTAAAPRQSGQVWERDYDYVNLTAGLALHCP